MSSRSLKKLHGEDNLNCSQVEKVTEADDSTADDDSPDKTDGKSSSTGSVNKKTKTKSRVLNQFELLADAESDDIESQNTYIEDSEHVRETQALSEHAPDVLPSNKKKKKKRKKKKVAREEVEQSDKASDPADEIETSLREVNQLLGENPLVSVTADRSYANEDSHGILRVEHKNLNPDSEMRRIFGSRVVQTEQSRRRNHNRPVQRSTWLVQAKDNWPSLGRTGITMSFDDIPADSGQYFRFEHSSQYQQVQFEFLDAVESFNPDNIMAILRLQPYHIAACLQLSEICRMGEDMQMATSLVERALYACEAAFHPLFNITQGNCHLDYKRPENRSFYVALFRHLTFVGQRGCNRTALEFCKLLLSLDSDSDPLCVLLMMDFYALRSEQYSYLIRLYDEWEPHRNLSQLPNFAYSVSLALYKHALETESSTQRADDMLADSLLMYPGVLLPLLEKCSVVPDSTVAKHAFFTDNSPANQPASLKQLQDLYIGRCFACWKEPEIVSWLEETVRIVIALINSGDSRVELYQQKRLTRYRGTPRNIYRHIIMSEIKDASANLPPDMSHGAMMSYDPLPPTDTIDSYNRPARPTRVQQDGNVLSSFLRSLLPNFNVNDLADQVPAEGAAGGDAAGQDNQAQSLRQGINTLMAAMGDLLQNIRMIDAPREDQDQEGGGVDGEEDGHNDWD